MKGSEIMFDILMFLFKFSRVAYQLNRSAGDLREMIESLKNAICEIFGEKTDE